LLSVLFECCLAQKKQQHLKLQGWLCAAAVVPLHAFLHTNGDAAALAELTLTQ